MLLVEARPNGDLATVGLALLHQVARRTQLGNVGGAVREKRVGAGAGIPCWRSPSERA
jgi:hypothetical protein